ncbi:MAG: ribosome rescue protein RqcH [Candidatus Bathyarchaeia archaeon]|jgi:predicted ribosome quality control (RQC) complex YloA/Tae2 family protein
MRKKEFTSFDIAAATKELKLAITDSRVNNIYQLDEKTLVFKLHKTDAPPIRLIVEAGRRLHSTVYAPESPAMPPEFCMSLRKYLRSAWLVGIDQYEFERIVTVTFRTKDGLLGLVAELFGEGNIILTSEKNQIMQALFFKRMRDRNILRNETLMLPPPSGKNPFKLTMPELQEGLEKAGEAEVVRAMSRFLGIGGVYAEEMLLRAGVEKSKPCINLTLDEAKSIFDSLQGLLSKIAEYNLEPNIVLEQDGSFLDVVPMKLKRYEGLKTQDYKTFNEAADEFFLQVIAAEKAVASVEVGKLKQEAERLKRVVADQEKSISQEEKKTEVDKTIGNTIYSHLNELQTFIETLLSANREGKDWTTIAEALEAKKGGEEPDAWVESFDGRNLGLNMCIDSLRFSINLRRSIYENANEYYERGKKAKQKTAGAQTALEESKKRLEQIEKELARAEELKSLKPGEIVKALAKRKLERDNKEWFEKFRWFTSSDGFLVVAGKDTVSNEVLIKKYTTQEDIVFHAEISGAPFTVVKAEGKTIPDQTLREAGEFAASFSRAWRENAGSADVYWVKVDQLSKSGPSGESVPHGAFAVVGKRNWMRGVPLKVAVGITVNDETSFVGGPVDAVKAKTKAYVVLLPGDYMGKELLQRILRSLMLKMPKEQREKSGKTSIEQIREYVPYTKGTIAEKAT